MLTAARETTMQYSLHINAHGSKPKPFTWEIFRNGEPFPFRKSAEAYRSPILAKIAGHKVIRELRRTQLAQ
jgi:hypothetical protein